MIIWFLLLRHHAAAVTLLISTAKTFNWLVWIEMTKWLFISGYWWMSPSGIEELFGRIRSYPYESSDNFLYLQLLDDTTKFFPLQFSTHAPNLKLYLWDLKISLTNINCWSKFLVLKFLKLSLFAKNNANEDRKEYLHTVHFFVLCNAMRNYTDSAGHQSVFFHIVK